MSDIYGKTAKRNSVKRNAAIVLQYVFLKLIYHLHNMFIFYPSLGCKRKSQNDRFVSNYQDSVSGFCQLVIRFEARYPTGFNTVVNR